MVRSLARGSMITGASLTLLALLATLALLRRERVLAVLLGAIDPRPLARFRVAIGCLLLINAVSLHAHGELLFSNEGLLSTVGGRFGSARAQFDDLVTPGLATLLKYPAGTSWSLLHFWDPPLAVHLHFALLYLACLGLILGKWTGVAKWTALVVYLAIWARDDLSFSGERVLTVSLLLLCLSDCGAALSLDARDRPLRPIPRWPQVLLVLQLIPIYLGNAIAKDGSTWLDGHAVHYAVTTSQHGRWPLHARAAELAPLLWLANHFTLIVEFGLGLTALWWLSTLPGPRSRLTRAERIVVVIIAAVSALLLSHAYAPIERLALPPALWLAAGALLGALAIVSLRTPFFRRLFAAVASPRLWIPCGLLLHVGVALTLSVDVLAVSPVALYLLLDRGEPALAESPSRAGEARLLSLPMWFASLVGAALVLVVAPRLWPWAALICAVGLIARARARGVSRRALVIPAFCAFHCAGALLMTLPRDEPPTPAWRAVAAPHLRWMALTRTPQVWNMYAPTPAVSVAERFLSVRGVDPSGRRSVVLQSPEAPSSPRRPWLGRQKYERPLRLIAGERRWPRPWLARYLCLRDSTLAQVILTRRSMPPTPFGVSESTTERARRFEREAVEVDLYSYECARARDPTRDHARAPERRRGRQSETPWHLLLIGLWLLAWSWLPAPREC
ncbi:MAG: HTTM domain-containing protein [Myxococcales bacterium]|nr:HTTM domain-containing protein [Myxococcales bacterium]